MGSINDILRSSGQNVVNIAEKFKQEEKQKEKEQVIKPVYSIDERDRDLAVIAGLIPEAYVNCSFDVEKLNKNIEIMNSTAARKFNVTNLSSYTDFANGLIATVTSGKLPERSYIIGAPNGFGKTSLVNDCIITLFKQGRVCAPYISLTELAQLRLANDKELLRGINSAVVYNKSWSDTPSEKDYLDVLKRGMENRSTYEKKPINIIGRFSYSEYLNCSLLFCYFSDVRAKQLESEMLKTVLMIRASKGLPTIAMISTSLNPYTADAYLSQYVWDEILEYSENGTHYDRVKHISCFKNYYVPLK